MEKHQQDSISSVGVGKEYPPSEAYSDHPPPAYHQKPRATAVQIARIAACTVIAVTFILGFFMLASAYITASASCSGYAFQEALRQELEDQPQYQHLQAEDPLQSDESADALKRESVAPAPSAPPQPQPAAPQQFSGEAPIQLRLPLMLDLDDIAGSLVEKNQRSRMNCVVEKRRAEEVMDHQPKTVRLPFGVNLTTDPRYEHVTGERMAIFCESGNDQRHVPVDNSIASPVILPLPEGMHLIPMPVPMGPHGPMLPPPPTPHMLPYHQPHAFPYPHPSQQFPHPPQQFPHPPQQFNHHAPPPPQPQPQQALPLPLNDIPMSILQRIAQDAEAADSKDDSPVHIIAREEVFPIFHPAAPEGRAMHSMLAPAPVPADMVQPPPPPHPEARQTTLLRPAPDHSRPHFVQPRSVRSVEDTFLKRDKRVKRCACDCAC